MEPVSKPEPISNTNTNTDLHLTLYHALKNGNTELVKNIIDDPKFIECEDLSITDNFFNLDDPTTKVALNRIDIFKLIQNKHSNLVEYFLEKYPIDRDMLYDMSHNYNTYKFIIKKYFNDNINEVSIDKLFDTLVDICNQGDLIFFNYINIIKHVEFSLDKHQNKLDNLLNYASTNGSVVFLDEKQQQDFFQIIELLFSYGANPNNVNIFWIQNYNPKMVMNINDNHNQKIVKLFLLNDLKVNQTYLEIVTNKVLIDIIKIFIEHGVDIESFPKVSKNESELNIFINSEDPVIKSILKTIYFFE